MATCCGGRTLGRSSFAQYGERALHITDPLQATARLEMHRHRERMIVRDVIDKLDLVPTDTLLDIGCGIGNLTIPLSFLVERTVGVDHPDCVARLERRCPEVGTVAGNWLDLPMTEHFTKILIYDVVHYLAGIVEVTAFIDKALRLLEPRGAMLVGDIPSDDLRERFDNSKYGKQHNIEWNETLNQVVPIDRVNYSTAPGDVIERLQEKDPELVTFNDANLMALMAAIRMAGYQAWLVPQVEWLPFAVQREDLLVRRP